MTVFHEIDVTQDNPEHAEYLTPAVLRVLALLDLGQRQKAGLGADWGPPVDLIYGEGGSLMTLLFCYDPMVTGDSARSITGATAYALVHDFKAGTWSVGLAVDVMYPTRALSCALQGFAARWPAVQLRLHTDALGAVSALALTGNSLSFTAVIGIIAMSAYKLTTKSIGKDKLLWPIFLISAAVTVITKSEEVWLFLGAGLLVWFWRAPPAWLKRGGNLNGAAAPLLGMFALSTIDWTKLKQIGLYFAYAGSFVFGSGLAIVPFLYGGVVKEYGWLTDQQFVDAVAVAMITPGPVVITTGFIGYLVTGFWGAVAAAAATFVPCYLFTVIPAPYFKKYGKRPDVIAFVDGVTAAAIGSIAGAVIVIGQRSISDWITATLAIATTAILWRFKKLPEPVIVVAAALIGLVVHPLVTQS